jgi:hypothetical protein
MNDSPHEDFLFNRQFLLSRERWEDCNWPMIDVDDYHLYAHPNLDITTATEGARTLFLLGYVFDYRNPELSNQAIADRLVQSEHKEELFVETYHLGGHFVIIWRDAREFIVFSDACGQREVFYDTDLIAIGSQPKLLQEVITPKPWPEENASEFYRSEAFLRSKIYISVLTQWENFRHLRPNHYLDIRSALACRYFPREALGSLSVEEAGRRAISILQGYLKAASLRYPLQIGVTAGYDSRILFLASRDIQCTYYTGKNHVKNNAIDVAVATKLAALYDESLEVRHANREITDAARSIQDRSIDFPRYRPMAFGSPTTMTITGNVSEVARSYFGSIEYHTGADLARIMGLGGVVYAEEIFEQWLRSEMPHFRDAGYDYRDMFYWEEKMGNWAAKGKTEASMNGLVYSPFCSHILLDTLLSTDRAQRDKHFNTLYDTMLRMMSPKALDLPVNPNRKQNVIRMMKRLGIYSLYRRIGIRYKLLQQ